jgi:hypothetical protein
MTKDELFAVFQDMTKEEWLGLIAQIQAAASEDQVGQAVAVLRQELAAELVNFQKQLDHLSGYPAWKSPHMERLCKTLRCWCLPAPGP